LKKRILFVGGTSGGGVATINNEVIKVYRQSGHTCRLVDTGKMKAKFPTSVAYLLSYLILMFQIVTFRPNLVYLQCSQSGYLHQSLFLFFAKLMFRNTIAHLHAKADLKAACSPRHLKQIIDSQKYIDQMVVLTEPCRQSLLDNGWRRTVHVIPNFISAESLPARVQPSADRTQFLYLGRMDWEKGIFEILEAARNFPEEKFIFVGDFADNQQEEKFAGLLARTPNAEWLGPMYGDEKYMVIAHSKFLLFPTLRDEFPMTLIESTILGCIPLVSPVGSVGEIIRDGFNGVFIKPGDTRSLVAGLHRLQAMDDLQVMADNGISFAHANFTSEAVRGKLEELVL